MQNLVQMTVYVTSFDRHAEMANFYTFLTTGNAFRFGKKKADSKPSQKLTLQAILHIGHQNMPIGHIVFVLLRIPNGKRIWFWYKTAPACTVVTRFFLNF